MGPDDGPQAALPRGGQQQAIRDAADDRRRPVAEGVSRHEHHRRRRDAEDRQLPQGVPLELAAEHADTFRAVVGLETTDNISLDETGYDDTMMDYFTHPEINQEAFRAAWCQGLHGPEAPEANVRETAWLYAQSGDGVYAGDLHFYTRDFDARDQLSGIDTNDCGVYLLTGEYDFSATPEATRRVADAIDGAWFEIMDGLGHYPMTEVPDKFNDYVLEIASELVEMA